jgi:hypothetical protein
MKIKTAFKIIFLIFLFLVLSFSISKGQEEEVEVEQFDVTVQATVDIDIYSQLALSPTTVEIYQPSVVTITMLNSHGNTRPGREIELYIDGDSTGVTIVQPSTLTDSSGKTTGTVSSSIPGAYMVCARDITGGTNITIEDCKTLYVTPVPAPVMIEEPQYTKGYSNTVMWNMSGLWVYQYYAEISLSSEFSPVLSFSGWINNRSYEFQNLENGQMYFYRVRARNTYGGYSDWSNVVFSVQDAIPPDISLISISDIGDNTVEEWDSNYTINIRYRITDNVGISSREFWCVANDGGRYNCNYTASQNGDFWDISIDLRDLEKYGHIYLFNEYAFCVEAKDLVDNLSRNCDARIEIPGEITEPVPEEEQPIPTPPLLLRRTMRTLDDFFDTTIGRIEPQTLEDISLSMTAVNIAFSFVILLTAFGYLPYIILQTLLAIQALLGFRKKGNIAGYVYNAITKEPIPQAMIKVFNESGTLIWRDITDNNGYYIFPELQEGKYRIEASARNYVFPSKIIFGKKDFPLENVYHGTIFEIESGEIPNFAIPMDQVDFGKVEKLIAGFIYSTKGLWKSLHLILFVLGLAFSVYAIQVMNVLWNYVVVAAYIPASVALFLNIFNNRDRYGYVVDEDNRPVEGVTVGLNDKKKGKLVSKRVTDELGRYRFVVGSGIYDLAIMNSDSKVINEDKIRDIEIKGDRGTILIPKIFVKKLEDSGKEDVIEPLKEL